MRSLEDLRSGSSESLGELYDAYAGMVYRVAYRLTGSLDEADDILQDVFVGLPAALRSYEGRGTLDAWLRRVAVRTSLMRLRAQRRRAETSLDATAERPPARTLTEGALAARVTLEQAIASLPDPLRVVFVLKDVEGFGHHEIGEMLGITARTSETRLHRARKRLRVWLEPSR